MWCASGQCAVLSEPSFTSEPSAICYDALLLDGVQFSNFIVVTVVGYPAAEFLLYIITVIAGHSTCLAHLCYTVYNSYLLK
jgi:hypothetical protein